jgi:hypothetical protein
MKRRKEGLCLARTMNGPGSLNAECDLCVTNLSSMTPSRALESPGGLGGTLPVVPQTLLFFRRTHGWVVGRGQL